MLKAGLPSWSMRPPTPWGDPIRTGIWSPSRASSAVPPMRAPPPVSTAPAGSMPAWPERFTSSRDEGVDLAHARLDDLRQLAALDGLAAALAEHGHVEQLLGTDVGEIGRAVLDLDLLGQV